jgi:hypothetical protein
LLVTTTPKRGKTAGGAASESDGGVPRATATDVPEDGGHLSQAETLAAALPDGRALPIASALTSKREPAATLSAAFGLKPSRSRAAVRPAAPTGTKMSVTWSLLKRKDVSVGPAEPVTDAAPGEQACVEPMTCVAGQHGCVTPAANAHDEPAHWALADASDEAARRRGRSCIECDGKV